MSPTPFKVRPANPSSIPHLLPLISAAYRGPASQGGWTTEANLLTGPRIDSAGLLAKINAPHGVVLEVLESSSDSLVACCELLGGREGSQVGYFGLFAVEPERQGAGLGREVLRVAEDYARTVLGMKRLEMQVLWMREELIAWYSRRGYALTGEKRPFPYHMLVDGAAALSDDLYFEVLVKDLVEPEVVGSG